METIKKNIIIVSIFLSLIIVFSGCTDEQPKPQDSEENSEEDESETRYDPCGNEIGNGNEIISGPLGPEDEDIDNPFRSLTVHPTHPDVLIIGTERNGFLKSIDGGNNWIRLRRGLRHGNSGYPEIYDIAFSQSNPDIIYAATLDGPGPLRGDYPSSIGGIYKSMDGGETWQRKNCGLENGWIFSIFVSADNPNNVIIGISGSETTFTGWDISGKFFDGGIFRSTDGGGNWNRLNIAAYNNTNSYMMIRAEKSNPLNLYSFGTNFENLSQNVGFIKSMDGGSTWTTFASELREHGISYFDISSNGTVIYAVDNFQIQKSIDSGETWSEYNLFTSGYAIAVFPNNPNRVLFSKTTGLFLSTDGLITESKVINTEGEKHISDIVIAPSNNNIIYAITVGYDLYKSVDAGDNFTKIINLRDDVLNKIP